MKSIRHVAWISFLIEMGLSSDTFDLIPVTPCLVLVGWLKAAIPHLVYAKLPGYQAMASKPSTDN